MSQDSISEIESDYSFEYEDEDEDDFEYEDEDGNDETIFTNNTSSTGNNDSKTNDGFADDRQEALAAIANNDNIKKSIYHYTKYTPSQFFEKVLINKAKTTSAILNLSTYQTFYLLMYFNWNSEKLMESYMEKYDRLLDKAGITKFNQNKNPNKINPTLGKFIKKDLDWMCFICCDDFTRKNKPFALNCGHEFCKTCYKTYVKNEMKKGTLIKCVEPKCPTKIQLEDFGTLFEENEKILNSKMLKILQQKKLAKNQKKQKRKKRYQNISFGKYIENESDTDEPRQVDSDDDSSFKIYDEESSHTLENNFFEEDSDSDGEDFGDYLNEIYNPKNYSVKAEYCFIISNKYAVSHNSFHFCPAPDCQTIIQVDDLIPNSHELDPIVTRLPIVTCFQSHRFCLSCKYETHYPLPCKVVDLWVQKCSNDSETANWIILNTKTCPKCHNAIEKNEGCNHMTCKSCGDEFCWICLGPWNQHGNQYYKCNRFETSESVHARDKAAYHRKDHEKYLHYFGRFQAHQTSINKDAKIYQKISEKIKLLQRTQRISWIEAQFLKASISTLLKARSSLQWSYVFSYYLENNKTNAALIFEENQTSLSNAVEDLSELFSISNAQKIIDKRVQFIQKSRFCISRQLSLIGCAEDGLKNNSLKFNFDIGNYTEGGILKKARR